MKLGIMQPYFFPYTGYFQLINSVDEFILFDIVNYKPKSWMNRNRILHPKNGWQHISYPVKKSSLGTKIFSISGIDKEVACSKIIAQFAFYKKYAPYTKEVTAIIDECFRRSESGDLTDICASSLTVLCERLEIDFKFALASRMDLQLPPIRYPGQWALEISKSVGAKEYINPINGAKIFREEEFVSAGVELSFLEANLVQYDTAPFEYQPMLSILDVMCWLKPDEIRSQMGLGS